jgi:SAM-dependent methyltransferase
MSLAYRIMYGVGFTPWDNDRVPAELCELIEGEGALAAGSALDIGCGTGTQAVYLAAHGWRVTAIDGLEKPLRRARARGAAAGVAVDWVRADATRLADAALPAPYALFFDRGCFHGLADRKRGGYVEGVSGLATPGATLLMMSFAPNRVPGAPPGADREEIIARFQADWELETVGEDSGPAPGGPVRDVARRWYRLRRR